MHHQPVKHSGPARPWDTDSCSPALCGAPTPGGGGSTAPRSFPLGVRQGSELGVSVGKALPLTTALGGRCLPAPPAFPEGWGDRKVLPLLRAPGVFKGPAQGPRQPEA